MKKKLLFVCLFIFLAACSCFAKGKATVTKKEGALFWELSGTDKKGKPSKVYILGTFHAGDERLYPLPQFVLDAFDSADIVCGEISTEGWAVFNDELQKKMISEMITDPEKTLDNFLTEEEQEIVKMSVGHQAEALYHFNPWALNQVLTSLILYDSDIEFVEAYDRYFINLCNEKNIVMQGLDDVSVQIDCVTYGSFEYQLDTLKNTIATLDDAEVSINDFVILYEAYLSGDEQIMEQAYFQELQNEIAANDGMEDYYDFLLRNRNKDWAVKIADYIENGGTTFIFAGTGHFLGDDSVFNMMRTNGTLK